MTCVAKRNSKLLNKLFKTRFFFFSIQTAQWCNSSLLLCSDLSSFFFFLFALQHLLLFLLVVFHMSKVLFSLLLHRLIDTFATDDSRTLLCSNTGSAITIKTTKERGGNLFFFFQITKKKGKIFLLHVLSDKNLCMLDRFQSWTANCTCSKNTKLGAENFSSLKLKKYTCDPIDTFQSLDPVQSNRRGSWYCGWQCQKLRQSLRLFQSEAFVLFKKKNTTQFLHYL